MDSRPEVTVIIPYYNPNLTLRKSNFALRDLKKEGIGEPYRLEV